MKWIKYQVVQSTIDNEDILANKKVEYNESNLAIAESEAYNGEYEIIEDEKSYDKKPLAIEFGGTGGKTPQEARNALGVPLITISPSSQGFPSNPIEGQIHIFYEG